MVVHQHGIVDTGRSYALSPDGRGFLPKDGAKPFGSTTHNPLNPPSAYLFSTFQELPGIYAPQYSVAPIQRFAPDPGLREGAMPLKPIAGARLRPRRSLGRMLSALHVSWATCRQTRISKGERQMKGGTPDRSAGEGNCRNSD